MSRETIINMLTETARNVVPAGSKVVLFGSQARGDANEESDWDVLVLLDTQRILLSDYDDIAYPIRAVGWDVDAIVNPILYTKNDWQNSSNTLFYKNVTKDGIVLWG
ncbi:MAG: nucleotidyltransferase domain-containing protein [Bacteroidales bacterium]|jgi:predicted nucleotidyltransferase|nr:nucleotidyltransferase domain-containing protein [Bacteroidales bacterium]